MSGVDGGSVGGSGSRRGTGCVAQCGVRLSPYYLVNNYALVRGLGIIIH